MRRAVPALQAVDLPNIQWEFRTVSSAQNITKIDGVRPC